MQFLWVLSTQTFKLPSHVPVLNNHMYLFFVLQLVKL